jgi:hypothetical protein
MKIQITALITAVFVFAIAVFLWVMKVPDLVVCWGHGTTDITTGWKAVASVWPLTLAVALTSLLIGGGVGRIAAKDGYCEDAELTLRSAEALQAKSLENMAAATKQEGENSKDRRQVKQERDTANLEIAQANARAEEAEARAAALEEWADERVGEVETQLEKAKIINEKAVGQLIKNKRKNQKEKDVDDSKKP